MTVAIAAMILFLGAPTVSAQDMQCPDNAHLGTEVRACSASGVVDLDCVCVCDRGYHPRDAGQPVSSSNPCVRNVRGDRDGNGTVDISNTVCIGDARAVTVPGGFIVCQCPDALDTTDHDADQDGMQETRRVSVLWDRHERRAMGVPMSGAIFTCMAENGLATQSEIDGAAMEQRLTWLETQIRTICGSEADATPDDVHEDCVAFHDAALASGGSAPTTITVGGNEYTLGDFAQRVLGRLSEIDATNERQDDDIAAIDGRVTALEARPDGGFLRDLADATHIRIGGFGRLGFSTAGPATGAGGASLELLFRFGDLPVGAFLRGEFGGQETGWDVGSSMYLSGSVGFSIFTGGRRDTTIGLGFFAEDLLHPFADAPDSVQGSHLGVAVGAELSLSIPLPGDAHWMRIRPALAIGHSERYYISDNGAFSVLPGAYIAPSLAIEFQPDW